LVASPRFSRLPDRQVKDRAAMYFKTMRRMGYIAMGVGSHEMKVGVAVIKKLAKKNRLPLLSSSIVSISDSALVFEPHAVKQVGALRMCFFSLLTESPDEYGSLFVNEGFEVLKPVTAARRAMKTLKSKRCDLVAVLSQLRRDEIDLVTDKVKGIDLVLGSNGQGLSSSLERVGASYFGDCFNKGKYVGELLISPGAQKDKFAIANLKASLKSERSSLARRVRDISEQLDEAKKPEGAVKLTPESTAVLQQSLAGLRAKLQRVTMELEGGDAEPGKSSLLALNMHPLGKDITDDKRVLRVVERYKKKWKVASPSH
jgi:2',3'-cyclic-nucleotide 2'-phosphodiesterase (5'-nucleotidase family)